MIANGVVYAAGYGTTRALDAASGLLLWSGAGGATPQAVANGTLYVGTLAYRLPPPGDATRTGAAR